MYDVYYFCLDNYSADCNDGYYGEDCERECRANCDWKVNVFLNKCNEFGQCICKPGWEGAKCDEGT